jgi:hypothetical protein
MLVVERPARAGRRSCLTLTAALAFTTAVIAGTATAGAAVHAPEATATAGSSCTNPQRASTVQGNPDISSVPRVASVNLEPKDGGLVVSYRFQKGFTLAPEGVYWSWTIYVYRHRSDADKLQSAVQLQVEDRGKGWEPTGWTILASIDDNASPVSGSVHTDPARDELALFFPAGFANLRPPFYWFASQEAYRAYLPEKSTADHQNWSVNGSVTTDCPAGVRATPNSLPDGANLLLAPA